MPFRVSGYNATKLAMEQVQSQTQKGPKKLLFIITKGTWGGALWETHGFPTPSSTGKQVFSRPFSSSLPNSLSI